MKAIRGLVAAVLVATGLTAAATVTTAAPAVTAATARAGVRCIGAPGEDATAYRQTRQFVENQAWWRPGPGQATTASTDHGHAHMGACIPERERLAKGNLTLRVRVVLHDNPGTGNYVSMVFKGTDYENTVQKCYLRAGAPDFTCPSAPSSGKGSWTCTGTCTKWLRFSYPISAFRHSGLQEVRLRGFVPEPDGREMRTNLNFQVRIANGRSRESVTRLPMLRGKGWYTHSLYCESALDSVPLPDKPVSGTWTPVVQQTTHSTDDSLPVTHSFVSVDPDFHASPPISGTVLHDADGEYGPVALSIDTTKLSNGVHKLHQRADCRDDELGSTNSGVLVVPFVVAN